MPSRSAETSRRPYPGLSHAVGVIAGGIDTLRLWSVLGRQRRHLASLDDRMLRDIGLTRADVEREYGKPFWRT